MHSGRWILGHKLDMEGTIADSESQPERVEDRPHAEHHRSWLRQIQELFLGSHSNCNSEAMSGAKL